MRLEGGCGKDDANALLSLPHPAYYFHASLVSTLPGQGGDEGGGGEGGSGGGSAICGSGELAFRLDLTHLMVCMYSY